MNADSNEPLEEQVVALAAACDEAVAAGATPADLDGMPTPPELRVRLQRGLACAQLLRQFWSTPDPVADILTPPTSCSKSAHDLPTRQLGRFQIRRELGRGGFGIVYLAFDPRLGREVALKLPQAQALVTPELRQRFAQEARAAAGLDHPNLVPIYEAGEVGPICYIASAYCPGITLAGWLKQRAEPVPFTQAAALAAALAEAVQHAHSRGVLHRDLKPANVLLQETGVRSQESPALTPDSWIPKITDFGLAKVLEMGAAETETGHATQTGAVLGTPSYMAPEQAAGKHGTIGPAVDVYALGAILYEVLTGRPPFHGETPLETMEQARTHEPLPPRRLRPRLALDLETICLKCLEKEPNKRYASAGDLACDLRRFLAGEPIRARPVGAWQRSIKWSKRHPAAATLCVVGVLLAVVGFPGVTGLWLQKSAALANESKERRKAEAGHAATLIALADRDWLANEVGQARNHLDEIPPEYRGERWRYLHRACHAELLNLGGPGKWISTLIWSPDGKCLATTSSDNSITVHDAASGHPLLTWKGHRSPVSHLLFNQTGEHLISAASLGRFRPSKAEVKKWDATTGKLLATSPPIETTLSSAFDNNGRLAVPYQNSTQKGVKLLDTFTGREVVDFGPCDHLAASVAFSDDGKFLATTESGNLPVSTDDDWKVKVWDAVTGKLLRTQRERAISLSRPAFSPDGQRLAWGISRGEESVQQVRIWEWNAGQDTLIVTGHTARVPAVAYHCNGRYLASGSDDLVVRIWDTSTGREVLTLRGHMATVFDLAFSPDGRRLASADWTGTLKVWDTSSLGAAP